MGSQGKVKKLMKGLAGQAKELSSQWGTQEEFGQGCDPIRFVWPTMMECVRAMQTGCVSSPGCCSYGSPPPTSVPSHQGQQMLCMQSGEWNRGRKE